ncbi:MAG TPA: c-type cytochrome domain-containing protein [Edaphobacter sp.]
MTEQNLRRALWVAVVAAVAVAMALWGARARVVEAGADTEAARPEFYTAKVKPIFQSNCFRCHAGMNRRGGLSMSTHAGMMKGGKDGVVIVPGDPAKSLLMRGIRHEGSVKPMPPKSKLSDTDTATIERWIRAGAVMPADVPVN